MLIEQTPARLSDRVVLATRPSIALLPRRREGAVLLEARGFTAATIFGDTPKPGPV